MIFDLSAALLNKLGYLILFGFILTKTRFFKNYLIDSQTSLPVKIGLAILWGTLGVLMTLWGTPVLGGIANSRTIPILLSGLLGGPLVGVFAGTIAGLHRAFFTIGGELTALSCGISTFLAGVMGGFLKNHLRTKDNKALYGFLVGVGVEVVQMCIILLIARPFEDALSIVKTIFLPMTFLNALGVGVFLLFIDQVIKESDHAGAIKAHMALKIANQTLPILRKGLNSQTAMEAVKTIFANAQVDAVSMTNSDTCLAFVGVGSDHHQSGHAIVTSYTKEAILDGKMRIAKKKSDIGCHHKGCKLAAVVVTPLFLEGEVIGTLKLYKKRENSMTTSDIELAKGLGNLFSTQLALSKIDEQASLLRVSELKTLRAQIQPHFLFNALNTIMSFIRIDPDKARAVLSDLSLFLRSSFKMSAERVSLEDELSTIKAYVNIEKARFEERLHVDYKIKAPLDIQVPPLLIQPLIENAIKHGIVNRSQGGQVTLEVTGQDHDLRVVVTDTGSGMSQATLDELKLGKSKGVGLDNIMKRLSNLYDTQLHIDSQLGVGTRVAFTLPIRKDDHHV